MGPLGSVGLLSAGLVPFGVGDVVVAVPVVVVAEVHEVVVGVVVWAVLVVGEALADSSSLYGESLVSGLVVVSEGRGGKGW